MKNWKVQIIFTFGEKNIMGKVKAFRSEDSKPYISLEDFILELKEFEKEFEGVDDIKKMSRRFKLRSE